MDTANDNTSPKPIKILIVITKSNFGGAQRYVYDLSRSLKEKYDVVVASGGHGILIEKLNSAGVKNIPIPSLGRDVNPFKDFVALFSLIRLIRKESPDIVHLNSSKIGIMGAVAVFLSLKKTAARKRPKTVFTAHAWAFNENRNLVSKTIITFLHWLTVYMCDKTISVSEAVKKQISHLPKIADKITTIHLGIERPAFYGKKNARTLLGIPEKAFTVGTIAELHPIKGLNLAIDAFKSLPFQAHYSILGEGQERSKLENKIGKDFADKIKLHGFVKDASQLIPAFDVFLLPSFSEALGYVLIESGYAGVPIIATSVGGIPEIIKDMESGILIHPNNVKEIERALMFVRDNKKTAENMAKTLKSEITQEFSLAKMVEKTDTLYRTI